MTVITSSLQLIQPTSHDCFVRLSSDVSQELHSPQYVGIKAVSSQITHYTIYKVDQTAEELSYNTIEVCDLTRFPEPTNVTIDKAEVIVADPLPISHIIISFPEETYKLLQRFNGLQLFKVLRTRFKLELLHQGDLLTPNGEILLMEPIDQGLLTSNTKITLVKSNTIIQHIGNAKHKSLDLSSFLLTAGQTQEFKLCKLKSPLGNDELIGYTTVSTLAKIGILTREYAELETPRGQRLVRLVSVEEPNEIEDDEIYLSPILLMNYGSPSTAKVSKTSKTLKSIPIAKKVAIYQLFNPIGSFKNNYQLIIHEFQQRFARSPQVISHGDLIPITIDTLISSSLSKSTIAPDSLYMPRGNPDVVVWLKVENIDDGDDSQSQFIVDVDHTSLLLSSSMIHEPPPLAGLGWNEYLNLQPIFEFQEFKSAQEIIKLMRASKLHNLHTTVLLKSLTRNTGKEFLVKNLCHSLGWNFIKLEGYDVLNNTSEFKTIGAIRGKLNNVVNNCTSLVVFIKHLEALIFKEDEGSSKLVELIKEYSEEGVLFIASTNDADSIPDSVRSTFKFEVEVTVPTEAERLKIFQYYLRGSTLSKDVSLTSLSLQSAGLTPKDLFKIVENAKFQALERVEDFCQTNKITVEDFTKFNSVKLTPLDFTESINDARDKFSDSIGAPKIPDVKWDDIGGLDVVKDEIFDTIDLPLKNPELFANGLKKRSGILFYGPPGTGKTLLAKAIATNFQLNFFSVKGPELLNMYIGESEANVRRVFQKARDSKPCVIFFDELDSVAPKRGNQGDSGGVMDRIVSQLLAELDGMSSGDGGNSEGVFVVGATNRPDLLDEALLRPGRFDKMVYLGIADDDSKQYKILEALTRKFKLDEDVDLNKVVVKCGFNFTGADFYALCSDSMLNAMTRVANECDLKIKEAGVSMRYWFDNIASDQDIEVKVKQQDFEKARNELNPSVSMEELQHYLRVRENFEGGKQKKR